MVQINRSLRQHNCHPAFLLKFRWSNDRLDIMKSALLALPSGGTVDLTNFVAIVPLQQTDSYQLLFTGLSQPLTLDPNDAAVVNTFLSTRTRDT